MKKKSKILILLLTCIMFIYPTIQVLAIPLDGYKQVIKKGGSNTSDYNDGVAVSKTIEESSLENYFDITLTVETNSKIEEIVKAQDLAVVLVMDISNTMNYGLTGENASSGDTRLSVAKNSVKDFISKFYEYSKDTNTVRQIGLITFNRDANDVFGGLKDVNKISASDLNKSITAIKAPGTAGEDQKYREIRWTNMEAGLKRANDLLTTTSVKNKYVIFLTDGLPTTYIKSGYIGYTPRLASHNKNQNYIEGNFYNFEQNIAIGADINAGTNYSEWGARKAEVQAYNMKNNGIKIYSIGVGITGQYTLYHLQYANNKAYTSTVDTDTELNNYKYTTNTTYKKPRYYTVLPGINTPSKKINPNNNLYNNTDYYKTWLSEYIGSDSLESSTKKYYYDSDNKEALENAYKKIFEDIKEMTSKEINASWVAEDPMNIEGTTKNIQYIGLYDDKGNLKESININNENESNTAAYNSDSDTITWDLKNSTREEIIKTENGEKITYYKYKVKYRIRLQNEQSEFKDQENYLTNGITTLDYIVMEKKSGMTYRTEKRKINFPIPEITGYLGNLSINKVSNYGNKPLEGVTFKLVHSSACPCLEERKHIDNNYYLTATSNQEGIVYFNNIPSGHKYKLYEDITSDLYEKDNTEYEVEVSYGVATTNINNNTIINNHKTRNLSIYKSVKGITTDKNFELIITATYDNNNSLNGSYNIIREKDKKASTEKINFIDGKAYINIKDKEKITIENLPYKINYSVEEINTNGYIVKHQINNEDISNSSKTEERELLENTNIIFINASEYILPATGSSRALILVIVGALLTIGPIIYIGYSYYQRILR